MAATRWFSVKRMKYIALLLVGLNCFLLVAWLLGAFYLLSQFHVSACFVGLWTTHFCVLFHFALAFCLASVIGDISREERRYKRISLTLTRLPYAFYQPFAWFITALASLASDALLLASSVRFYGMQNDDVCQDARLMHITLTAIATVFSLLSVLWLAMLSSYNIRPLITRQKAQ